MVGDGDGQENNGKQCKSQKLCLDSIVTIDLSNLMNFYGTKLNIDDFIKVLVFRPSPRKLRKYFPTPFDKIAIT